MVQGPAYQLDLTTKYEAVAIYYEDIDSVEYVRRDEPCVYRRIDGLLTLVLSMRDRSLLGFQLTGFKNFYLKTSRPCKAANKPREFPLLIAILEEAISALGKKVFEHATIREAYDQARNIAEQDKVQLKETMWVA